MGNLMYNNLGISDPATYNVLVQLKVVVTGVTWQCLLAKRLSSKQWLSLFLITGGCMLKEAGKLDKGMYWAVKHNAWAWMSLLGQIMCSVLAGVYTEVLLKGAGDEKVTTNLQNICMYIQSILCNVIYLSARGTLSEAVSLENATAVMTPLVMAVILTVATAGVITGFLLKHLDSIVKSIAGAFEVMFTMFLSWLWFSVPLTPHGCFAALIVGCGVALYSRPSNATVENHNLETKATSVTEDEIKVCGSSLPAESRGG